MTRAPLNRLGVVGIVDAIERGDTTAAAVTAACLDRIAERNEAVRAFVALEPARALAEARRADAGAPAVLRGVPFAVKDVIDTADYPTQYGSPIYQGHQPRADAACVAAARERGAVLLGKVATGEFATQTPSDARNPLRLAHTPGGSSSGSAAAVADGMAPVAFGTQTTASIVRPAVYCGVVGYKPTFGMVCAAGLKGVSPTQDTIGVIARSVEDAAYFTLGLHGARTVARPLERPRIAVCLSRQWDYASPATLAAIERLEARLQAAGAQVERIWLPASLEDLIAVQGRIFAFEARQALAHERLHHFDRLSPRLQARLESGRGIEADEYLAMRAQAARGRAACEALFGQADAILYPAAEGEAEAGLASAGSPRYGALWTLLHLPSVSFPIGQGPGGLPVGAQLIGRYGQDTRVLAVARHVAALAARAD